MTKVAASKERVKNPAAFVLFDSLRPSQQSFSYVRTGLFGLNQYLVSSTKQGLMCLAQ